MTTPLRIAGLAAALAVSAALPRAAGASAILTDGGFMIGWPAFLTGYQVAGPGDALSWNPADGAFRHSDVNGVAFRGPDRSDPSNLAAGADVNRRDGTEALDAPIPVVGGLDSAADYGSPAGFDAAASGELRISAFILSSGELGAAGALHDGSTGKGLLTVTGAFDYDSDGDGAAESFVGETYAAPLLRAEIVEVAQKGDGIDADIRLLWRIDGNASAAAALFDELAVTSIDTSFFATAHPFEDPQGFDIRSMVGSETAYAYGSPGAEIPLPPALPLLAAAAGALALLRRSGRG